MSDAQTSAPATTEKKKRKPQGPRQVKPFHLLIRATDENGETIPLSRDRVTVEVVKDPAVLLDLITGGDMDGAVYTKFTPAS